MSHHYVAGLFVSLVLLVFLSGFFSAAETGLMAVNRYRLRHQAKLKKRYAILALRMLKRPDRLLGVILIGNNAANIVASVLATILATYFLGNEGVVLSTILLTIAILVLAEVAPKTLAAFYPERVVKLVAWPIFISLKVCYPFIWCINGISNGLLRLCRINVSRYAAEPLSREELRSIVYETSSRMPQSYQHMLLGILDLNKMTVNDVMVPRHKMIGIDLNAEWSTTLAVIKRNEHSSLPVYRENMNDIVGVLYARDLNELILTHHTINQELVMRCITEPYFVPENTSLHVQLVNFQQLHQRVALIVDEYGEIQGMLTLVDILEEIVGEFATNAGGSAKLVQPYGEGSFLIEGSVTIRELNRATTWSLPTDGPKTLSGLIIEYLEAIPVEGVCVRIEDYPIEIMRVQDNRVKTARVFPPFSKGKQDII